ncbi:hypothetical protein PR048_033217 [Dryococelus australis]|uniref:PiggyBac transposable element-derived protein domain-containing protein n=1 Tax=Dryococelus australis TaxID=614101 RepID=A0ABQ9G0Y5_9NEOP|nr:hypothetical protein PR048_033217 [Dryococelus australis]
MAARKRSDIFVCGKENEAMMRYFEMLTSGSLSSEDGMDCDNIRLVAANQSRAADNETDNSSSESGKDNTAVDTSCGDFVDWNTAIVMETMQKCDLLNKGYSYIDNWYSSPVLFHRLFSAGTNVCGTVRTNRKHMPKELAKEKLKVGEAVANISTNITAMKWKDKREVSMLSTKHTLDFAETGKVHRKMQTKIMKPTAVIDYNMKMRGFDVGDQILSKFHVMHRYSKACKKVFFYVVDMMLLNSYVLYKKLHGKDRTFHVFKQKLAKELLKSYFKEDVVKRRSATPGDLPSRLSGQHFPEKLAPSVAKGAKFAQHCVVCL